MGMFKQMKQGFDVIRSDELKELKKKADAQPKTNPIDGLRMANQAMDQAADMQQNMGGFMNMGEVYSTGVAGNATIDAIRETGQELNGAPVVDLDLTVNLPGREPYTTTHRQAIAHAALPNFQPGKMQPVRVDQNDPNQLMFG
jgi:hypothetical protein